MVRICSVMQLEVACCSFENVNFFLDNIKYNTAFTITPGPQDTGQRDWGDMYKFWVGTNSLMLLIRECCPKQRSSLRNSANSRVKIKNKTKKVLISKYARIFMQSGVKPQKKGYLLQNLRKNSSCSQTLGWQPVFWKSQALNCTSVAPSLLLSLGHSPRLGGVTILVWGSQAVIWGSKAPECSPPWRRACLLYNSVALIDTYSRLDDFKTSSLSSLNCPGSFLPRELQPTLFQMLCRHSKLKSLAKCLQYGGNTKRKKFLKVLQLYER